MSFRKHLPKLIGGGIVVGLGIGVILLIVYFVNSDPAPQKKKVQQITLVAPPPPPPPPKVDRPPPEVKEEVEVPEPEEQMEELPDEVDAPPPGELLGLDADGAAGSDGFGLVGRKGGRSLLDEFGSPKMLYAANVQRLLEDALTEEDAIRAKDYSLLVQLWIEATGEVSRVELISPNGSPASTGDRKIDQKIKEAAQNLILAEAPPSDWEQPLRIKLGSRL